MTVEKLNLNGSIEQPEVMVISEDGPTIAPDILTIDAAQKLGRVRVIHSENETVIIARQAEGDHVIELLPLTGTCEVETGKFKLVGNGESCARCSGNNDGLMRPALTATEDSMTCQHCGNAQIKADRVAITMNAPLLGAKAIPEWPTYDFDEYTAGEIIDKTIQNGCPLALFFPNLINKDALSAEVTAALRKYDGDDPLSVWVLPKTDAAQLSANYCIREEILIEHEEEQEKDYQGETEMRLQIGLRSETRSLTDDYVEVITIYPENEPKTRLKLYVELDADKDPVRLIIPASSLSGKTWNILARQYVDDPTDKPENLLLVLSKFAAWMNLQTATIDTHSVYGPVELERPINSSGEVTQWATALTNHNMGFDREIHVALTLGEARLGQFIIQKNHIGTIVN